MKSNPYFDEFKARTEGMRRSEYNMDIYSLRRDLVKRYAWAIPNEEAIDLLAGSGPLIEAGAGCGYWAWMIKKAGGEILAFDCAPPYMKENIQCGPKCWVKAIEGGPEKIVEATGRVLFLCWPPYSLSFAFDCLKQYRGNKLIYVGEGYRGCTGDDAFHGELEDKWECTERVGIPQWWGIHDGLSVWER